MYYLLLLLLQQLKLPAPSWSCSFRRHSFDIRLRHAHAEKTSRCHFLVQKIEQKRHHQAAGRKLLPRPTFKNSVPRVFTMGTE